MFNGADDSLFLCKSCICPFALFRTFFSAIIKKFYGSLQKPSEEIFLFWPKHATLLHVYQQGTNIDFFPQNISYTMWGIFFSKYKPFPRFSDSPWLFCHAKWKEYLLLRSTCVAKKLRKRFSSVIFHGISKDITVLCCLCIKFPSIDAVVLFYKAVNFIANPNIQSELGFYRILTAQHAKIWRIAT